MKKILSLFLVLCLSLSSFAFAVDSTSSFKGSELTKDSNGNLITDKESVNAVIKIVGDQLKVQSKIDGINLNLSLTHAFDKSGVSFYTGKINGLGPYVNADAAYTKSGTSILIYDEKRINVKSIVFSKNIKQLKSNIQVVNEKAVPAIKASEKKSLKKSDEMSTYSHASTRTKRMYYSGLYIPFAISGGTVDGTLTYQVGGDTSKFIPLYLDGYIDWNTGFDSISITNTNEMYGTLWSTPGCPERNIQRWNIGLSADESGQYYLKGTVSYALLVNSIPIVYWSSSEVTLP